MPSIHPYTKEEDVNMNLIVKRSNRLMAAAMAAMSVLLFQPTVARADGLESLSQEKTFTAHRLSSVDPNHRNLDFRRIEPGQTLTLGEIEGAGQVTHMWFTINAESPEYLSELVLRVYWDGEKVPAIECPLGDFFALGFGKMVQFKSVPVSIGESNALNCYWPMPFSTGARFTVTNEGTKPIKSCYYNLDYQLDHSDQTQKKNTYYFHTQYRQAYPAPSGKDLVIADVKGRGQYVGTFLSLLANSAGWWGEGNDKFYVDGASTPTIEGTGSEDYFCGAWNFGGAFGVGHSFYTDYFGVPYYDPGEKQGIYNTCYRWHILDPVPFTTSLRFDLEHGKNGSDDVRSPLPNNYSTVAFYYVDHANGDGKPLPELHQRISLLLPQKQTAN